MAASHEDRSSPTFVAPMAAESVSRLPEGPEWLYELKLDGYRAVLIKDGATVRLVSRNEKNLTPFYPRVVAAAQKLRNERVVLDGEIVALDPTGRPSFQSLQHRGANPSHPIVFYAFDVLHVDGHDVIRESLSQRRARLTEVIEGGPIMRISLELPGTAADIVNTVRAAGLEGVIAKRRDSIYQPGKRSSDWVKLKLENQQEFVIGGYRPDGAHGIDALLVGYYEGQALLFAGKVRAGMVSHVRRELLKKLKPLSIDSCPFSNLPDSSAGRWGGGVTVDQMSEMQWVRVKLLAQIRFVEWTAERRLRHAKFLGLRNDKSPTDVRRES